MKVGLCPVVARDALLINRKVQPPPARILLNIHGCSCLSVCLSVSLSVCLPACILCFLFCIAIKEFRELLDRLFSWCDLCLPANEQAFAESHRQKIQKFQVQIVQEMKRSNSARSQVPKPSCCFFQTAVISVSYGVA